MSVPWFLKSRTMNAFMFEAFFISPVIKADRFHVQKERKKLVRGLLQEILCCISQDRRHQGNRLLHVIHTETLENSF